jgi:hypothetical protein
MTTRERLREIADAMRGVHPGCCSKDNEEFLRTLANRLDAEMADAAKPGGRDLSEYAFLRGCRTALARLDAPLTPPLEPGKGPWLVCPYPNCYMSRGKHWRRDNPDGSTDEQIDAPPGEPKP